MSGRSLKLLLDAASAIAAAQSFVAEATIAQYLANHMLRSAVERQLEILGEASSQLVKLDPIWVERIPDLRLAIGLRNRIIHTYDGIDDDMVLETVKTDLPGLQLAIAAYLSPKPSIATAGLDKPLRRKSRAKK